MLVQVQQKSEYHEDHFSSLSLLSGALSALELTI